ncbi:calcium-binding and spermatid-specific protein 1 [Echinops telfairi]|uniref:Calcium-binding and spermatid-specific protein 1 n=1 Tax=Echinops telfairi TaxID=9371 RepID=A0ABM0IMF1_ECHTE|nr:calcium-binding and spermatid-specific protein 1 [Echinops telfairi]
MAEDGSPKIYSHHPSEKNRTPTEARICFGVENTIPKPETTITSEGDHVSSVNDYIQEGDFSPPTGNKNAPPEIHTIESTTHTEKDAPTLTGTTNSMTCESVTENFISAKIGNISQPFATISLIDFSNNLEEEDILLDTIYPGDKNVSVISEVSGTLKKNAPFTADPLAPSDTKVAPGVIDSHFSDTHNADEIVRSAKSFMPEVEISSSTEKNITTLPDITSLAEEKVTEIDLILSEKDPDAVANLTDSAEENFITVFEFTDSAERERDDPGDIPLTDEESVDDINVWLESENSNEEEAHSVLLTAVESRYDFIVPTSVSMNSMNDSPTPTTKELSENDSTESVTKITEPSSGTVTNLDAPIPVLDTSDHLDDTFTTDMDLFKLLGEDPDGFMI